MGIRLLVVDDAPFIHEVLRHLLSGTEIDYVGEAFDGVEAVEKAKELQPDVILMDLVMPRMNGFQATSEILKILPNIRIVACSTVDNEDLVTKAIEIGCCDFVLKPFTGQGLIEVIKKTQEIGPSEVVL